MDNNELLLQIAQMFEESEKRTAARFTQLEIKIENEVSQQIRGLFDGYKLTHEKQWEMERSFERKTTALQMQIDLLQARLDKLESA